jgi:hypothetical protein
VAPSGRAALAWWSLSGISLARGTASSGFGKPEAVDTPRLPAPPGVGVSDAGRVVVAWIGAGANLELRAAGRSAALGPKQVVVLRAAAPGSPLVRRQPKVVTTSDGRAVVVVASGTGAADKARDSRVEAVDWPASATAPSSAATLSRAAGSGEADVVAQGASAAIAWTQRPTGVRRSLWITRWTRGGLRRPDVYDTHALGLPVQLVTARRGALDAFYRAGRARWFTVRLSAAGLYGRTSAVTPATEKVGTIDVASSGRHAAAAWTIRKPRSHVELARPAG